MFEGANADKEISAKEDNDITFMFKGIGEINPRKTCNVIYAGKEESESRESTEDSYMSITGLLQPAESNKEDSDDAPDLIKAEEISDDENKNNIANLARSTKAPKEKTRPRASCRFSLCDSKDVRTDYLGLLGTGSTSSLITKDIVDK